MEDKTEVEIDDSLYSRQRYMLGDGAMIKMAQSNVLLSGLGGLGIEIAKSVVLAGIKSITLHDTKLATYHDLASQFFLREEDIKEKKNRAEASAPRLAELNPYVNIQTSTSAISDGDFAFLAHFQCVILTEAPLSLQLGIDKFCRSQKPPIKFIGAGVQGVFSWAFCDFGPDFEVVDSTGEEPKEFFIWKITKANPGVVTTLDNRMHGLQTGDKVSFKEIVGMAVLNGSEHTVKVLSPYAFSICDTTGPEYEDYQYGGIGRQVKTSSTFMKFESLETQLSKPDILTADLSKMEIPLHLHHGIHALHLFQEQEGRFPEVRSSRDAEKLYEIAKVLNEKAATKVDNLDEKLLTQLAYTCRGCFSPLTASLGGIVGQEVLKALTGKYTPLKQWIYLQENEIRSTECECPRGGSKCSHAVALFLHGYHNLSRTDIECQWKKQKASEVVKTVEDLQDRYDSLRICTGEELLNKLSNLRLFMVGCGAIGCELLKNFALLVCPETEETLYTDQFFESQDLVVNALDNVEARRYMDCRCVSTQRALLESGTMGPKGHVQRDPPEEEVPHCTLKSFPAVIEHTIQWARDKAKQLLHAFPLDTRVKDGSLFWQSPKRPPMPQQFDTRNELHMLFVRSSSKLHADTCGIKYTPEDLSDTRIVEVLCDVKVPEFRPSSKEIETDETASKPGESSNASSSDTDKLIADIREIMAKGIQSSNEFEKDDDSNGHIDFITSASNLRATMYSIETADRLKTKKIAGKIVPAIATTTAAVAGLVTIELVKVVMKSPAEEFKNCFMNLALPYVIFSQPGPPEVTVIREGLSFSNWDKWVVQGTQEFKLKDFVKYFKDKYGFVVSIVVHGVKIVYVPLLPGHSKRLEQKMTKLIKAPNKAYVDLTVSFEGDGDDDLPGPPVRYYFGP
ncbi:Ubiquitin-like modifier-activating enzyme 6 [Stylophora pistillata]|uniref:Ubiquitin-like modifier-activating enzyme 6 n=1 Tax=Stylophora pistillata TaxID=50429 RepID=A0A2B4RVS7_STYPI|nr:Ubiquitin-like modifier-activating enzyme 6 [Stylophora pistillata]